MRWSPRRSRTAGCSTPRWSPHFDNGAIATAEASFAAAYGYDVRGEVFGSAGMVTMGETARTPWRRYTAAGRHADTVRGDVELFRDAYAAEFTEFTDAVREGRTPAVTGEDARRALLVALACVESVKTAAPVLVGRWTRGERLRLHPGRLRGDGVPRPAADRTGPADRRGRLRRRDLGLDRQDVEALAATGAMFSSMTGYIEGDYRPTAPTS